jgi:hypothetical protein
MPNGDRDPNGNSRGAEHDRPATEKEGRASAWARGKKILLNLVFSSANGKWRKNLKTKI